MVALESCWKLKQMKISKSKVKELVKAYLKCFNKSTLKDYQYIAMDADGRISAYVSKPSTVPYMASWFADATRRTSWWEEETTLLKIASGSNNEDMYIDNWQSLIFKVSDLD